MDLFLVSWENNFLLLFVIDHRTILAYSILVLLVAFKDLILTFNVLYGKNRMRIPQTYKNNIMLPSGQIICVDQAREQGNDIVRPAFVHNNENNLLTQQDIETYFAQNKPFTNKNFRLDTIVNHFGVNRTYVSKFINVTYNCNVSQFINYWRLKEVEYLQQTEREINLENLAVKAGFSDYRHYVRAIKNAEKRQHI